MDWYFHELRGGQSRRIQKKIFHRCADILIEKNLYMKELKTVFNYINADCRHNSVYCLYQLAVAGFMIGLDDCHWLLFWSLVNIPCVTRCWQNNKKYSITFCSLHLPLVIDYGYSKNKNEKTLIVCFSLQSLICIFPPDFRVKCRPHRPEGQCKPGGGVGSPRW